MNVLRGRWRPALAVLGATGPERIDTLVADVVQATEARVVAATPTTPAKLLLLTGDKVVAVYTLVTR